MAAPAISLDQRAERRASRGLWGDALRRLLRNRPALLGLVFIGLFVLSAVLAPVIAPYGPLDGSLAERLHSPSAAHLMGTDSQGRDEFSRVLYGSQVSLVAGIASVVMGVFIGGSIGALAGGVGGKLDSALMRLVDIMLAMPGILLAIGIVAFLGRGLPQIMFAVAVVNVPIFARILRGSLLSDATKFIRQSPWLLFFPGAAIVISAIGFNLLGDGLRESLDPRMRR
jgi:peptide/nickel transport system permease protein